jgi:hypothetical protein
MVAYLKLILFLACLCAALPCPLLAQVPPEEPAAPALELPHNLDSLNQALNGGVQPADEANAEQTEARLADLMAATPLGGTPAHTRMSASSGGAAALRKSLDYQYAAAIRQALQTEGSTPNPEAVRATPNLLRFLLDILEDFFSIFPSLDRPAEWGYWFLWGLVALTVVFIVLRILKIDLWELLTGKARNQNIAIDEMEVNIHELDLQALQNQALAEQDYRRAIRYAFLNVLKDLDNRKHIRWEPRKTNNEYLAELKPNTQVAFRPLARQYERAWFSLHRTDESSWVSTQELLNEVRKTL